MQRLFAVCLLSLPIATACSSSRATVQALNAEETHERFMDLFDMEIQNRAFALLSAERGLENTSSEGDKIFLGAWRDWEQFLKVQYAPYATKYGLSQEPRKQAKMQASLGLFATGVLSEQSVMEFMLDETIEYVKKLEELEQVSPAEDRAFFEFVVRQERVQVDSLRIRVEGATSRSGRRASGVHGESLGSESKRLFGVGEKPRVKHERRLAAFTS